MGHDPEFMAASYVILRRGDEVLLSRRYNTSWNDGNYSLPSGHMEKDEEASKCALREIKEEVNVEVKKEDLIFAHCAQRHSIQGDGSHRTYFDVYFFVDKWSGEIKNNEVDKCDELRWAKLNDLPENMVLMLRKVFTSINKGEFFSEINDEE